MRALFLLLALPLLGGATAEHCMTYHTDEPEISLCSVDPCHYGVVEWCQPDCIDPYNIVLYEESNGIEGLQRADPYEDGTCHGVVPVDTIVVRHF